MRLSAAGTGLPAPWSGHPVTALAVFWNTGSLLSVCFSDLDLRGMESLDFRSSSCVCVQHDSANMILWGYQGTTCKSSFSFRDK